MRKVTLAVGLSVLIVCSATAQPSVSNADATTAIVSVVTDAEDRARWRLGEAIELAKEANRLCEIERRAQRLAGVARVVCLRAFDLRVRLQSRQRQLTRLYRRAEGLHLAGRSLEARAMLQPFPAEAPTDDPDLPFRALLARVTQATQRQPVLPAGYTDSPQRPRQPARRIDWPDFPWRRLHVSLNQAGFIAGQPFSVTGPVSMYGQVGTVSTAYQFRRPRLGRYDVGGRLRVGERFAIGGAYSEVLGYGAATVSATVPAASGPLRPTQAELPQLERAERSVHIGAGAVLDTERVSVALLVGPSFIEHSFETVDSVQVQELSGNQFRMEPDVVLTKTKSRIGVSIQLDGSWMFADVIGIGGFVRYSHTEFELPTRVGNGTRVYGGGVVVGWGVRIRL